jgi:hypothetical protein
LIILAGAVSLVRGLQRITAVDPGWRADGVLTARLGLAGPKYVQLDARRAFIETLHDRVGELPGMSAFAIASSTVPTVPFGSSTTFLVEGREDPVLALQRAGVAAVLRHPADPAATRSNVHARRSRRPHSGDGGQRDDGSRALAQRRSDR